MERYELLAAKDIVGLTTDGSLSSSGQKDIVGIKTDGELPPPRLKDLIGITTDGTFASIGREEILNFPLYAI